MGKWEKIVFGCCRVMWGDGFFRFMIVLGDEEIFFSLLFFFSSFVFCHCEALRKAEIHMDMNEVLNGRKEFRLLPCLCRCHVSPCFPSFFFFFSFHDCLECGEEGGGEVC